MALEQYAVRPDEVEVFHIGKYTDVILRKNITQTTAAAMSGSETDGESTATVWACEEQQIRVKGTYTRDKILADFDTWWTDSEEKEAAKKLTNGERLDALETDVSTLETQIEDAQLALCDVYELVVGASEG